MNKKIAFAVIALLAFGMITMACSELDMKNLMSTGALGAKINSAENQGMTMVSADWNQIYYLVAPTAPYQTASIRVAMAGESCFTDNNGMTLCEKTLRIITGDVWEMKNGTCKVKNVR